MTDKEVFLKIKSGEINYFEFLIKKYSYLLYQYLFLKKIIITIADGQKSRI